jgi:NADP-dependent 3-hydroxy acid dehydrogenase YdfG
LQYAVAQIVERAIEPGTRESERGCAGRAILPQPGVVTISDASDARERAMRLQGKVAIVTGAGGGIGAAICRHFAAEGAALIGVDVDAADVSARSRRPR